MSDNQKKNGKHLFEIMTRFKNGQATEAEIYEIDQWYENSTSNKKYADGMSSSEKLEAKQKLLQRINSKIGYEETPVKRIRSYRNLTRYAIAAVILLVVGAVFYFKPESKKSIQKQIVSSNEIAPGNNKAILTLANGEKISLTDAINGQIATQSGIRITKTGHGQLVYEATEVDASLKPEYNTIEAPAGGQWLVVLPDHSKVWLNAQSSITYPTRFTGTEREVKISGEVYFEVASNKKMPFKVQSGSQTVEVLGTHFNIMAYEDEKLIKTTLLEGSVKVSQGASVKLLVPGQQAQVGKGKMAVTNDVNIEDVVAWKNGYFMFDEHLESIMAKVARWYNVEVVYTFKPDHSILYNGKVSRSKNISALLKIIEFNGDVHFKIEGRRIIVMR